SKSFVGTSQEIRTSTTFPVQSAGVPETVRVYVSQLTPSTHDDSSAEAPPTAVPSHATPGPVGPTVPAGGLAASAPRWADATKNAHASAKTNKLERRASAFTANPPCFRSEQARPHSSSGERPANAPGR